MENIDGKTFALCLLFAAVVVGGIYVILRNTLRDRKKTTISENPDEPPYIARARTLGLKPRSEESHPAYLDRLKA